MVFWFVAIVFKFSPCCINGNEIINKCFFLLYPSLTKRLICSLSSNGFSTTEWLCLGNWTYDNSVIKLPPINALSENIKTALSFLELRYNCVSSVPELNFSDICLHLFISRVEKPWRKMFLLVCKLNQSQMSSRVQRS